LPYDEETSTVRTTSDQQPWTASAETVSPMPATGPTQATLAQSWVGIGITFDVGFG
jgi:hypothetical protein